MKIIYSLLCLFLTTHLKAQYYYKDNISTQEANRQMKTYFENKVNTVSTAGYDAQNSKASDFLELQEVQENGLSLKITSHSNLNHTILINKYDSKFRIISETDSSASLQNTTSYFYDANGRVSRIQNLTKDTANDFNQTEIHQWIYTAAGKPEKMWRIINNTDSLEIRFSIDEDGNVADEKTYRKKTETGAILYYYDDKNRLSDIVRYNKKFKKLIPDIMFEYDEHDRVIQKITTTASTKLGYLIWRYIYNDKGLKTKEALFNSDKQLTGKIEFTYTFSQ